MISLLLESFISQLFASSNFLAAIFADLLLLNLLIYSNHDIDWHVIGCVDISTVQLRIISNQMMFVVHRVCSPILQSHMTYWTFENIFHEMYHALTHNNLLLNPHHIHVTLSQLWSTSRDFYEMCQNLHSLFRVLTYPSCNACAVNEEVNFKQWPPQIVHGNEGKKKNKPPIKKAQKILFGIKGYHITVERTKFCNKS